MALAPMSSFLVYCEDRGPCVVVVMIEAVGVTLDWCSIVPPEAARALRLSGLYIASLNTIEITLSRQGAAVRPGHQPPYLRRSRFLHSHPPRPKRVPIHYRLVTPLSIRIPTGPFLLTPPSLSSPESKRVCSLHTPSNASTFRLFSNLKDVWHLWLRPLQRGPVCL